MHRLSSQRPAIGRCLSRCPESSQWVLRPFSKSAAQPADDNQSNNNRPLRTRGAESSAKAFELIRKLPMGSSSSSGPPRNNSSSGPPKELVRKPRPQGSAATSQSSPRFSGPRSNPRGPPRSDAAKSNRSPRKNNNKRNSAFNSNDVEEENEQPEEDEKDERSTYSLLTDDSTIDRFTSLGEARAYAKIQDFVEDYIERAETIDEMEADAKEKNKLDDKYAAALDSVRKEMDNDVKEALQFTSQTDEAALPRHEPQEVELEGRRGEVGGATVGSAGMANAVEEGLRYIAKRTGIQGTHYIAEKELARRLVAGEFVKFRHLPEKREVLRIAENMGYKPETPKGEQHVGFETPDEEAKRLMVRRLVQGQYQDPADAALPNNLLKSVARIAGANASYTSEHKATLLKTIRGLLPAERPAGQRGAQRRR